MTSFMLVALLCAFFVGILAQQANFVAYVVQAKNAYTIDGSDGDWGGNITTTHIVQDQYGNVVATFRASFDNTSLYFFVNVVDSTPLVNSASYNDFQQLFYQGDALTVCFGPDTTSGKGVNQRFVIGRLESGDSEIYVMRPIWSDTSSHPYDFFTTALGDYHVDYLWHAKDSTTQVALTTTSNGWAAEFSIPFTQLGYSPTSGQYIPFDIEVIGSNAFGTSISSANWWHSRGAATSTVDIVGQATLYPYLWGQALLTTEDKGPQPAPPIALDPAFVVRGIPISFTVPDSGLSVSLNVVEEDSDFIVAELVRAKPMNKGPATVYWNGRDRENKPVPGNKNYRAKVATFKPLTVEFAASLGNGGRPSWVTADGLGSLGGVHYGGKYIISADAAGDSRDTNTNDLFFSGSVDEGVDGIRRVNSSFFAKWTIAGGIFNNIQGIAHEDGVFCYAVSSNNVAPQISCYDGTTRTNLYSTKNIDGALSTDTPDVAGTLNICSGTIIYAEPTQGALYFNRYDTGGNSWDTQQKITTSPFISTCRNDANSIYVVFSDKVQKYDIGTNSFGTVISSHQSFSACTVDMSGNIYVSETGTVNQIFKYNSAGALQKTYGTAGGRGLSARPYNPLQFSNVYSMAVTPNGHLYAVERYVPPYRTFVIDTNTGDWIRDIYGPVGFTSNIVDLDDNSKVMYYNPLATTPVLVEVKIDFAKSQADPTNAEQGYNVTALHLFSQNGIDNSVKENGGTDIWQDWVNLGGYGAGTMFTGNNGKRYFFFGANYQSACVISMFDTTNGVWYPVSSISGSNKGWSDTNHNKQVDNSEVYQQSASYPAPHFTHCDKDLNLYGDGYRLKPASIDSNGVPNYRDQDIIFYINASTNVLDDSIYNPNTLTSYSLNGCPSTTTPGDVFLGNNLGPAHDQGFWDRASDNRIMRIAANGTVLWIAGHHNFAQTATGDINMIMPCAGELDGIVIFSDILSQFVTYTDDGLTTGWLLVDPNTQLTPQYGIADINIENAGQATVSKDPITGKRLITTLTTGDVRVLEISGPFDKDITRTTVNNIFLPTPLPRSTQDDVTAATISAYPLNYVTMGDGTDATFYGNYGEDYQDGYDYEWRSTVPSLYIYDRTGSSPTLVSEMRLRRDAGELAIFVDVLDSAANFPFYPPAAHVTDPTALFGVVGVEILIGPAQNGRTKPVAGDTRIYLTGVYLGGSQYTGYVLACRPASPAINHNDEFRTQDVMGQYKSAAPTGTINFSKMTQVPGSIAAIVPRTDKQGYRIEAYIPMAVLGDELTSIQSVSFIRSQEQNSPTGTQYYTLTQDRRDLKAFPFAFNAAVYRPANPITINVTSSSASSIPQKRYAWVSDGFSGFNATSMNPSAWGANARAPVVSISATTQTSSTSFSYLDTISASPAGSFDFFYTAAASKNAIFGGGWYTVDTTSKIVTGPVSVSGFSLSYVSGDGGPSTNNVWRWAHWDASNLFMPYGADEVNAELVANESGGDDPVSLSLRLTTNMNGAVGVVHVLYGQQGGNSFVDGYLNISDTKTKTQFSGLTTPGLLFDREYHQGGQEVKESTFKISGTNDITITHVRNHPQSTLFAYISAVWVEIYSPSYYSSPANVPLYGFAYGQDTPVISVEYFNGNQSLGTANPETLFTWKGAQAGVYQINAIAKDKYQASAPSSPITVTVYGPAVSSVSPANGSTIFGPVSITLTVDQIGPSTLQNVVVQGSHAGGSFDFSFSSRNYTYPLSPSVGLVSFNVTATDKAGAHSTQNFFFTYTDQPPTNSTSTQPPTTTAQPPATTAQSPTTTAQVSTTTAQVSTTQAPTTAGTLVSSAVICIPSLGALLLLLL